MDVTLFQTWYLFRRRRQEEGVKSIMSTHSDKEQIYAITRYLEGLSEGQSANAKATIAELNTKLSSIFGTDNKSVDDFLALDYGSNLSDILMAGVSRLNVSGNELPNCLHSSKFKSISHFSPNFVCGSFD